MIQKIKRPLSILLSIMMVVSLFTIVPISASAATITSDTNVDDLSVGDILTGEIVDIPGFTGYTVTLPANGYGTGEAVINTDMVISQERHKGFVNGRVFVEGEEEAYQPYVKGEKVELWIVTAIDHDEETITLTGYADPTTEPTTEPATEPTTEPASGTTYYDTDIINASNLKAGDIIVCSDEGYSVMLDSYDEITLKAGTYMQEHSDVVADTDYVYSNPETGPFLDGMGFSGDHQHFYCAADSEGQWTQTWYVIDVKENESGQKSITLGGYIPTEPTTEPTTEEPPTDVPVTEPTTEPTTEPAAEPTFVKATSADEFTADNMGSCTYDQAKAWAEANLDTLKAERAAVGGSNTWVWIAYAPTSRTGSYSVFTIDGGDKFDTSSDLTGDIDTFKFFLNEGDIIYYVSNSAEPATEEPPTDVPATEPTTEPDPAADVTALINALPTTVTVNDKAQIEAARAAYNALSDDEKAKIDTDTLSKLTDAETALTAAEKAAADQAAADPVIDQINALPADITLNDKAAVDAARQAFTDLTDDQKNLVTGETLDKLAAAEKVIADREGAKAVEDMINALPDAKDITLADKDAVNAANQARLNLPPEQADYLTFAAIGKLFQAMDKIEDLEAAKAVEEQIEALPEATDIAVAHKDIVEAARAAYDALTPAQQALVSKDATDKLAEVEEILGYGLAAYAVDEMIRALPENITLADKEAVQAARDAYNALTPEQEIRADKKVLKKLIAAEKVIADLTAVDNVETLISDLPVQITLADKNDIEAARAAYNALTDAQKAMVNQGIYQDLVNAESLLADLTAVNNVETLINDLPDPTQVNVVDKPDVEAARAAYNALTDTQKAIVNADILQKLADDEQRIADIIAAGVVNQMIMQNIPSADEVTLADEQTINSVREAYDALTDAQKDLIEDDVYKKLTDAEKSIADQKAAAAVEALIDALPAEVTLDDTADVTDASAAYNALTDEQKALVDEDKVQKLRDLEKSIMDQQSAADVEALIDALPSATDVTLDDKAQIDFAVESYENLTDEQKELVPVDSRIKLGAVQIALALVEKDAADKAAAAEVTELIEALPSATSVTPDDKDDIEAARAAYDALTDDQKALVSTQNKLKLLLVEAALPIAIDNAAAEEVEELIEALPNAAQVTVDDKDAIEEASDAYDALTAGQKQLVKLADRLKLQNVKAALQQAIDEAAADEVEAMIEDLPDAAQVTVLDKEAIDAAAEAYDNLTDNQKKLVLLADRVKLAAVKAALENAEDIAAADAVEELIEALPNAADVTVDDEEAIDAAGAAYNALTDNQKQLVVLADRIKLQNVQAALAKAINDAEAAQKVTDQINALPDGEDVTFDDLRDIAAARVAYTLLTPDQKALVPEETLNKLVVDEAVIAEIIPAEAVKVAINSLPAPEDLKLADKALVEAARNAYEDLTDYQKALIDEDTLAKLTDAEAAIEAIEADKAVADVVAEQIKALPSPISVTIDDKDEIEAVKAAYDELTDAQKDLVSAADKLKLAAVLIALDTAKKIAEDEAAADAVEQMIEALPDAADVTVDDEEAIDAAGAAYNALTDDQKRMVVLADRIKLQNVQNALAKAINDAEAAQKVIDQINALPEAEDITFDDLKDVAAATLAYALLTHDQKQLVDEDTRAKLTAAQDALDDLFEVEGVKAMINALPDAEDVTINDKAFIEAVRENYDALTDAQKALIDDDTYAKLTDAEDALEAIEEDIAAAQEVSEQIRELPSALRVTVDDKEDIEAVKEAYDALTDAQKAFVPTADKLKLAAVLGALDAAEKIAEDEAAADAVEELIEALPDPADVTIDDKDDIDAAVEAYNALTDDQKRLVVLADRIKLALDDTVLQKIENDIAAAEAVTEQIEALPEAEDVTVEDFDDIVAARAAYNALTDDQKALVDEDTLAKLADDEAALADAIEVEFVKALINELPAPEDVTINDEFFIEAVREWYDELSDAQKDMIDEETYQKLVDAEEALAALTKFTVTWMNGDEVLEVDTDLPSGATPHYDGETPTKATDDQYVYEFMGWDPDLALVTADVTYNAVFDTYLIGDVNMDGTVDIFDAVEIQKYASGKEPLTKLQLRIADINKDGNVDILDASAIQRITSQ